MTTSSGQASELASLSRARRRERPCNRPIRSSAAWSAHFRTNASRRLPIPWERGAELSEQERRLIAASLPEFQQGEGLEGGHFFRCVRAYAERAEDPDYIEAHRLFMIEERRHADDLGRFLTLAGIPLLQKHSWLNLAFRWFGSRGGVEMTLRIVVLVEILAQTYYAALQRATGSLVLRRLCTQILHDEKAHIRFQCERLALLRRQRHPGLLWATHWLDRLLFAGGALACWCGHWRTLRAGGHDFRRFWRSAWRDFEAAEKQKDPRAYPWEVETTPCRVAVGTIGELVGRTV